MLYRLFREKLFVSASTILLFMILFVLLILKIFNNMSVSDFSIDGGYYFDVARHINDGVGLKTRISLYHKGYTYFPHPTAIYPLWPLVLGYSSRIFSLQIMAVWLPTFLYFLSLVFAYCWANKMWAGKLFSLLPSLKAGHFLVIFLGINRSYFRFTSMPYTEGLAFTLLFAFFLRSHKLFESPRLLYGLEVGLWLGILLLTRVQWIVVVIAVMIVYSYAILVKRQRSEYVFMSMASCASMIIVLMPFWAYVSQFSLNSAWFNFFYFSVKSTNLLSNYSFAIEHMGFVDSLRDRMSGFLVAFNLVNKDSYIKIFQVFIYFIPLSFFTIIISLRKFRKQKPNSLIQYSGKHYDLIWLLPVLFAIGSFILIHLLQVEYISKWYFNRRHAIPIVLLVFFSFIYLSQKKSLLLNCILLVIMFVGISMGMMHIIAIIKYQNPGSEVEHEREKLVEWLQEKRAENAELTIAISDNEGQRLVWRSKKINYHWVYLGATTLADYDVLFNTLRCDYLVIRSIHNVTDFPFLYKAEKIPEKFENFDIYRVYSESIKLTQPPLTSQISYSLLPVSRIPLTTAFYSV